MWLMKVNVIHGWQIIHQSHAFQVVQAQKLLHVQLQQSYSRQIMHNKLRRWAFLIFLL